MKLQWRPEYWGLSSRIVALSLLLLLIVQGAVFSVVRISIEQSAKLQVEQELLVGERVWRRLLDQNAQTLTQGATVLAADFGFRAAISTQDEATIRSALENNGARINATITALMDTNMGLRAVGEGQDSTQLQRVLSRLTSPGARDAQGSQVALIGRTPYQFVLVPVRAPVIIGWVLMGFPINQKLLDDMRDISEMHLALVSETAGEGRHIVSSTLPPGALRALEAATSDVAELPVDDDRLIARSVKLDAGAFGSVRTLLFRSANEVVAPFRQAQVALAWITGLGVVLFAIGSVFAARRVTTPLRSLVSATETLGRGQYDLPMQHVDRHDEIGDLAKAFDAMRVNIGAQQNEIRTLAYWDRLTGLPNRARFREAVHAQILAATSADVGDPSKSMAIVMLDIDRFKHVNDVLGYAFGDQLLIAVAKRLTQQDMRASDMVARLGGDEFAVMLTGSTAETAVSVEIGRAHV